MPHETIVIGGGISGLAASWRLTQMGIDHTLIEVKDRLGGRIMTRHDAGFCFDGGDPWIVGAIAPIDDLLAAIGLADGLIPIGGGDCHAFRDGSEALVRTLVQHSRATYLMRMAVSSLGWIDDQTIGVCLENGLMLGTRGVILAAPARYAERMLLSLGPEAVALADYAYDPIAHVMLGCDASMSELPLRDANVIAVAALSLAGHAPPDGMILRADVRLGGDIASLDAALTRVRQDLPATAIRSAWAHYWAEAESLTNTDPDFPARLADLRTALAPRIALVGSDYCAPAVIDRLLSGIAAADQVAGQLSH